MTSEAGRPATPLSGQGPARVGSMGGGACGPLVSPVSLGSPARVSREERAWCEKSVSHSWSSPSPARGDHLWVYPVLGGFVRVCTPHPCFVFNLSALADCAAVESSLPNTCVGHIDV